ncbi:cholesterol 24-hydroxylase-like [Halichondria panicea]|uniref:cholesterol 24-hydroxylase-like n=1 Tax=Halichondria panicea TaxID=6063 RepID=UPI00312B8EEA
MNVLLLLLGAFVLIVCLCFLAFTGYVYHVHNKYSHIPTPKYSSFYKGHMQQMIDSQKGDEEVFVLDLFFKWYQETDSKVYVIFFFWKAFVVVIDPSYTKEIIVQVKNNKPKDQADLVNQLFGERFLGNGLVSVPDYDTWKPRRKLYDPAFNKSYLKSLLPSFNKCVDVLLDSIRPLADGETDVPMKQHLAECTLYVISKVAFGSDFSDQWDDKSLGLKRAKGTGKLTFLISNVFKGLMKRQKSPFFQYIHPFEAEAYRETVRAIRTIGRDCIKKRIAMVERGVEVPNDILTHILGLASTKETVSIEDLVDDFATFYIAGQETTGNLLTFAVAQLHLHPDILARVQMEVDDVLGTKAEVTGEDLERLQYTEQVLLETLRMHPPVGGITKELCTDTTLGDITLPAGTMVFMGTILSSQMPEYFDDPDIFNPSRFDQENKQPSSFVYFPFGLGHRACIGKHFAMMEAKMILARLIQTFKLTLPENYKLVVVSRGTLQPKDDVPCKVELRL